jgi:hypothetical protein
MPFINWFIGGSTPTFWCGLGGKLSGYFVDVFGSRVLLPSTYCFALVELAGEGATKLISAWGLDIRQRYLENKERGYLIPKTRIFVMTNKVIKPQVWLNSRFAQQHSN